LNFQKAKIEINTGEIEFVLRKKKTVAEVFKNFAQI